jgi:hypothetical protein
MFRQVDGVARRADPGERRFDGALDRGDERDDRPVMRRVGRYIEHGDTLHRRNRIADGRHDLGAAAF